MIGLMASGGIALWLAALGTPLLIRWLSSRRLGQQIRDDGPFMHLVKAGTPTMGGVALVVAAVVGYLVAHVTTHVGFSRSGILLILVTLCAGGIGLLDDWIKVRRRRSLGLTKRGKFGALVAMAVGFALAAEHWAGVDTHLSFTRWNSIGINLGSIGWIVWAVVVIVGSANAVNLTDGLDGLASGSATFCFAIFAILGYWQFRHFDLYHVHPALDLALASVAAAGGCLGFLWWNAAPARIFMGDTGSLAIGSALGVLALQMNLDLLLPIIGGLFVIVTLSVVVQVISYRLFHRRVFLMAPLHHHFELLGWPETTVIVRFWILGGLFAALGLGIFYGEFLAATSH